MPYACSIPGCRGNYKDGPKVHCFKFPNSSDLCKKWMDAIPRKDFTPTKHTRVCELHFPKENIKWSTTARDPKTGYSITINLVIPRLDHNAVPTIFSNYPKYIVRNTFEQTNQNEKLIMVTVVNRTDNAGTKKIILDTASGTIQYQNNLMELIEKNPIRRKIHDLFLRHELPNLDKVLKEVNDDPTLPNFKKSRFYKLMQELNFKGCRHGGVCTFVERDDVVLWRRNYLRKIRSYRNENRKIYFIGDIWISSRHTIPKIWNYSSLTSSGLKNLRGRNDSHSFFICNIASEDGLVLDSFQVFESQIGGIYFNDADERSFEDWFSRMLPKLEDNSVVVLDKIPYHSRKVETFPNVASSRTEIQNWLNSKHIDFDETLLKVQLLAIVNEHKKEYVKYIVDEIAKSHNKEVLWLPPYHDDLNLMELVWEDVKNYISDKKITFQLDYINNVFFEALANITAENCETYMQHIQQNVEKELWQLDIITEKYTEPYV